MKHNLKLLSFLIAPCFSLSHAQAQTQILNFQELLSLAEKNSLAAERARAAAEIAVLDEQIVHKLDDPSVTAGASLTSRYTDTSRGSSDTPYVNLPNSLGHEQSYSVNASTTLWDFGRSAAREEKAKYQTESAKISQEVVHENLRLAVARGLANLQYAKKVFLVSTEQAKIASQDLSQMERNYRNGLRSEADLLKSRVDLGRANIGVRKAQDEIATAELALKKIVYDESLRKENAPLSVADSPQRTSEEWQMLIDKVLTQPTLQSSKVKLIEAQKLALQADVEASDAKTLPSISGSVFVQAPGSMLPLNITPGAQLQLSWLVPWNGLNKTETLRLSLLEKDLTLESDEVRIERIEKENSARLNAKNNLAQLDALQSQLGFAQKLKELVRRRYEAGRASAFELSTAEEDLLAYQLEILRLNYQLTLSSIDILDARGQENFNDVLH